MRETGGHRGARRVRCNGFVEANCCKSLPIAIVIAESDDLIRDLLEGWLRGEGYEVRRHYFDASSSAHSDLKLVIADISDPGDADGTLTALREAYASPILALSARFRRGLAGSTDAACRLRVAKVLPKPFTRDELLTAVRHIVAK